MLKGVCNCKENTLKDLACGGDSGDYDGTHIPIGYDNDSAGSNTLTRVAYAVDNSGSAPDVFHVWMKKDRIEVEWQLWQQEMEASRSLK